MRPQEPEKGALRLFWACARVVWPMLPSAPLASACKGLTGCNLGLSAKEVQTRGQQRLLGEGCEPRPLSRPSSRGSSGHKLPGSL